MDWIYEYEDKMFKEYTNKESLKRAVQLKHSNMPEILYKYRTFSPNSIDALKDNYLIAAKPELLNDIHEGVLFADYDKYWRIMYSRIISVLELNLGKKMINNIFEINSIEEAHECIANTFDIDLESKQFKDLCKDTELLMRFALEKFEKEVIMVSNDIYRICSLSGTSKSNTMWSHYANEHKGFCLGYGIRNANNLITELTFPIRYRDKMIEVEPEILTESVDTQGMILLNSLSLKSINWIHEQEWRIIIGKTCEEDKEKIKLPYLEEIILGSKISEENAEILMKIAREKKIKLYKMFKVRGSFELEKILIDN